MALTVFASRPHGLTLCELAGFIRRPSGLRQPWYILPVPGAPAIARGNSASLGRDHPDRRILRSIRIVVPSCWDRSAPGNPRSPLGGKCPGSNNDKAPQRSCRALEIRLATTYSPGCYSSTIGATGLNFSVRNGKRWTPVLKSPKIRRVWETTGRRSTP
jgi:hypothetical protein